MLLPSTTIAATIPDGKTETPFTVGNEVICLKEIQKANHSLSHIF